PPRPSPAPPSLPDALPIFGGITYPFDRFRRADLLLTLEGVSRDRFTDRTGERRAEWEQRTGGIEPQVLLSLGLGYDTTRIHPRVGPIGGSSAFLVLGGGTLPERAAEGAGFHPWTELDLQHNVHPGGRTAISL